MASDQSQFWQRQTLTEIQIMQSELIRIILLRNKGISGNGVTSHTALSNRVNPLVRSYYTNSNYWKSSKSKGRRNESVLLGQVIRPRWDAEFGPVQNPQSLLLEILFFSTIQGLEMVISTLSQAWGRSATSLLRKLSHSYQLACTFWDHGARAGSMTKQLGRIWINFNQSPRR